MSTENNTDPFDDLLDLENQYYNEGYNLGFEDGSRAGRTEGRIFGIEKGSEKFADMSRLNGRAAIWSARVSNQAEKRDLNPSLRPISATERLKRHVDRLKDLTDPETLSTENTEDAVADFDERLKDVNAKATLISKIVGESAIASSEMAGGSGTKIHRSKKDETTKQTAEMEDFVGLPGTQKKSARRKS